jgi:very-short-patch-repair endonuclease
VTVPPEIKGYLKELRARPTKAEACLLLPLMILCRCHNITLSFRQPISIGSYRWRIVDFLLDSKLAVELDGRHRLRDPIQRSRDRDRDARIEYEYQIRVLRIPDSRVMENSLEVALELVGLILDDREEKRHMSRFELEVELQKIIFKRMGLPLLEPL